MVFLLLMVVVVLLVRVWRSWCGMPGRFASPHWRTVLFFSGLIAISLELVTFAGLAV